MKKICGVFALSAVCLLFVGQALAQDINTASPDSEVKQFDMPNAVNRALENNRRLRAFQYRADGADKNVSVARTLLFPKVQANAGWTKIKNPNNPTEYNSDYIDQTSKTYSLQAQQNLFDGLIRFSNLAQAKAKKARAEEELRKTELETINSVQTEFFKLVQLRADAETYQASVNRLEKQREAAEAFRRLAMAPRLSVLQADTALAQAKQRLSRAISDAGIRVVKLRSLLGYSEQVEVSFQGALNDYLYDTQLDLNDCIKLAQKQLPELVMAKKDIDIANEDLNMILGRFFPKVDAVASYNKQNIDYSSTLRGVEDIDRKYYTYGLNLSWEIFSSGETVLDSQAKKKLLKAAEEDYENIKLNVYSYVQENHSNLREAKNQIEIARIRTREAQEAYDQASMRFRSGIGTSIDLLDAQEKMTTAESSLNQAHADYLISLSNLYRSMGEKQIKLGQIATSAHSTPAEAN